VYPKLISILIRIDTNCFVLVLELTLLVLLNTPQTTTAAAPTAATTTVTTAATSLAKMDSDG